jgi:hypothetical protein
MLFYHNVLCENNRDEKIRKFVNSQEKKEVLYKKSFENFSYSFKTPVIHVQCLITNPFVKKVSDSILIYMIDPVQKNTFTLVIDNKVFNLPVCSVIKMGQKYVFVFDVFYNNKRKLTLRYNPIPTSHNLLGGMIKKSECFINPADQTVVCFSGFLVNLNIINLMHAMVIDNTEMFFLTTMDFVKDSNQNVLKTAFCIHGDEINNNQRSSAGIATYSSISNSLDECKNNIELTRYHSIAHYDDFFLLPMIKEDSSELDIQLISFKNSEIGQLVFSFITNKNYIKEVKQTFFNGSDNENVFKQFNKELNFSIRAIHLSMTNEELYKKAGKNIILPPVSDAVIEELKRWHEIIHKMIINNIKFPSYLLFRMNKKASILEDLFPFSDFEKIFIRITPRKNRLALIQLLIKQYKRKLQRKA